MYMKISISLPKTLRLLCVLMLGLPVFLFGKNNKYRLIWNDDPATTMTVGWNQYSGKYATVHYDVVDYGTATNKYANSQTVSRKELFRGMNSHFARLKGLSPSTTYYFIIKDSEGVSERFWFKTAPDNPYERLSIIAGGDSRNHRKGRQNANMLVAKLRPDCVMFGGDMTNNDNDEQWKDWMQDWQLTITKDRQIIPIIPARGNHEYSNGTIMKLFDAPNANVYYALNFGGNLLRAYTLNSLIAPGGDQSNWLEKDLKQHQNTIWRFAQYHHPIRPHTSRKSEKQTQYNSWARLFYDYQMQLVVECDAHVCKTTYPIRPTYQGNHDMGFIRDDERGTVYVGEGCWGAPLRPANDNKAWTRASGSFNQIKWIFVDSESVALRTIKTDNAASVAALSKNDRFSLPKGLEVWSPSTGSVVEIYRRGDNFVAVAPKEEAVVKSKKALTTKSKPSQVAKKNMLPLVLANFDVTPQENIILIKWNTLSIPAQTICELQRAESGADSEFKTIRKILITEDNATFAKYEAQDSPSEKSENPFAYYRIKTTLPNGSVEYSEKEISISRPWSAFPLLPIAEANSHVIVEYNLLEKADVTLSVFTEKGAAMRQHLYPQQIAGNYIKKLDILFLQKGKYIIRLKIGQSEAHFFSFEKK